MVTDFHSHILPGIDDGSRSVEESIAMLRMEAEQGVTHVVATPHFYPQYQTPEEFLEKRTRAEEMLREEMQKHEGLPYVSVGAEVYFFRGIGQSNCVELLTIAEKKYILLEMPVSVWTDAMYEEIEGIYSQQGITPVIAHVDRYLHSLRSRSIPNRLERLPVMVQANASFFTDRRTAGLACRMLKKQQIHLLGSDCHNLTDRKPNMVDAISCIHRKLGDDAVDYLLRCESHIFG